MGYCIRYVVIIVTLIAAGEPCVDAAGLNIVTHVGIGWSAETNYINTFV